MLRTSALSRKPIDQSRTGAGDDELLFIIDDEPDQATVEVSSRAAMQDQLEQLCRDPSESGQPSVILIAPDPELVQQCSKVSAGRSSLSEGIASCVAEHARDGMMVGRYGEGYVLLIAVALPEGQIHEFADSLRRAIRDRRVTLSDDSSVRARASLSTTALMANEMAAGVVGRLERAIERARMRGGDRVQDC